jgi:hypothetical protein
VVPVHFRKRVAVMAKRVQVVLHEDVLSLGKNGDLVEVAK